MTNWIKGKDFLLERTRASAFYFCAAVPFSYIFPQQSEMPPPPPSSRLLDVQHTLTDVALLSILMSVHQVFPVSDLYDVFVNSYKSLQENVGHSCRLCLIPHQDFYKL